MVITISGNFKQWIPLDLRSHFGSKTDITKLLKTNDKSQAIMHGSALHQQFNLVFTPANKLNGKDKAIFKESDGKLEEARELRKQKRQQAYSEIIKRHLPPRYSWTNKWKLSDL